MGQEKTKKVSMIKTILCTFNLFKIINYKTKALKKIVSYFLNENRFSGCGL